MEEATAASLCLRVLGPLDVALNGESIPESRWPRKRTKTLLKVLLTAPGQPFSIDQLSEALLPTPNAERATAANIQARVSELRRLLEPGLPHGRNSQYVITVGKGYAFNRRSPYWLDMEAFEAEVDLADRGLERGEWVNAIATYETALDLYRGDLLPEDRYAEWAQEPRSRLRQRHLEALSSLASCYAELGRLRQAISCCRRILGIEPHRESVIRQLMEFQHRVGRRAQAIDTFEEGARALRERLSVEPSAETLALYERIQADRRSGRLDPLRLAVLPFASFSPDPEDGFIANGMTEEIIGHLSRIRDLRVIARTSVMLLKGAVQSVHEIARDLDVGSIVEGSVRRFGDRIRVSVQLIDGDSEEHIWAEEFDGAQSDLLSTQRVIAERVARALKLRLLPDEEERLPSLPTHSLKAHLLYIKGFRHLVQHTDPDFEKAISRFEEALSIDPAFATAHAKVAHAWMLLSRSSLSLDSVQSRVERALKHALVLDPQESEAHAINGLFQWAFKRDSIEAEAAIRRAIRLNPSNVEAHECLRDLMANLARYSESLAAAKEALTLSSGLDPGLYCGVARALIGLGRVEEAFHTLGEARAITPEHVRVLDGLASAEEAIWRWDEAEGYRSRLRTLAPNSAWSNAGFVRHLLARGRIEEALELVHSLPRDRSNEVHLDYLLGWALIAARRHREAIEVFADCAAKHTLGLPHTGWQMLHQLRAVAHSEVGEHEDALHYFEASYEESTAFGVRWTPTICEAGMALTKARMGDEDAVSQLLRRTLGRADEMRIPTLLAVLYFSRCGLDEGFKWLRLALDRPSHWPLSHLKVHPWFDPARNDPRFAEILGRVNLAD